MAASRAAASRRAFFTPSTSKPVRVERSRDTPQHGAVPMGISTSARRPKFILSAAAGGAEGLDPTRRAEERRVGKECVTTCSDRRSPDHQNKNDIYCDFRFRRCIL